MTVPAVFSQSNVIAAQPADDMAIIAATVGGVSSTIQDQGIKLHGWVYLTPDADATSITLAIVRGTALGAPVGSAVTIGLAAEQVAGGCTVDVYATDLPGTVGDANYSLELGVTDASSNSVIHALMLSARVD